MLALSEVQSGISAEHEHSPRLCVPCISARHREFRPLPTPRPSAELIAQAIRRAGGNVWPAVIAFDISYRHACRIRAGYRPGGLKAEPIPYRRGPRHSRWVA